MAHISRKFDNRFITLGGGGYVRTGVRMVALVENRITFQIVYHPKYTAINIFMKLKYNKLITVRDQENEPHSLAQKLNFDVDYKKRGRCGNV